MIIETITTILLIFLLPIFPFSMVTNKIIFQFDGKTQVYIIAFLYILGLFLLRFISLDDNMIVALSASLSGLLYAFRMLSVENLSRYLLFFYSVVSSYAWVWKSTGGRELNYNMLFVPAFFSFLFIVYLLIKRFGIVHDKIISSLGKSIPWMSLFFVLSMMLLQNTPVIVIFQLFHYHSSYVWMFDLVEILTWILLNYSGIRVIERLIYGKDVKRYRYKEITPMEAVLTAMLLVFPIIYMLYYLEGILR